MWPFVAYSVTDLTWLWDNLNCWDRLQTTYWHVNTRNTSVILHETLSLTCLELWVNGYKLNIQVSTLIKRVYAVRIKQNRLTNQRSPYLAFNYPLIHTSNAALVLVVWEYDVFVSCAIHKLQSNCLVKINKFSTFSKLL